MKLNLFRSLIIATIVALSISSCKKDETDKQTQNLTALTETALADDMISGLFVQLSSINAESKASFELLKSRSKSSVKKTFDAPNSCAAISAVPLGKTYPKTISIDFAEGCTFNDVVYKGKISAILSGSFASKNASVKISMDNYFVNDTKLEGTLTILNNGKNAAGNPNFSLSMIQGHISNKEINLNLEASLNMEWIEGQNTASSLDDVFAITGSSAGVSTEGVPFSTSIIKPLIKSTACPYTSEGTIEHKLSANVIQILDYGDGECDNKATVTSNGIVKELILRK